jgi:hypothetical protein
MQTQPFFSAGADGVTVINPPAREPGRRPSDYKTRPVQVAVHRDLTLEIHGENFSAKAKLDLNQAMGLAMMALFVCRDHPAVQQAPRGDAQ